MGVETASPPRIPSELSSGSVPSIIASTKIQNQERGKRDTERGKQSEERVAAVLTTLAQVNEVRRFDQYSPEDLNKIDIFVELKPNEDIDNIHNVHVQVKSSKKNATRGKGQSLGKKVEEEFGTDSVELRKKWRLKNRHIVINGGFVFERQYNSEQDLWTRSSRPVTDEEIISSFTSQLTEIVNFAKETRTT